MAVKLGDKSGFIEFHQLSIKFNDIRIKISSPRVVADGMTDIEVGFEIFFKLLFCCGCNSIH